jgi:NADH:ubiquinone oxidoreductase subunit 2 (subunit N)
VISEVFKNHHTALVVVMILTSVIGMYYYLKMIIAMYTPIDNAGRIDSSSSQKATYVLLSVLMIALFFSAGLVEILF